MTCFPRNRSMWAPFGFARIISIPPPSNFGHRVRVLRIPMQTRCATPLLLTWCFCKLRVMRTWPMNMLIPLVLETTPETTNWMESPSLVLHLPRTLRQLLTTRM